jgi:hypothetical protein
MRIKSFSEARGIFESEEFSLEPHIYCFGGGGGGDDSGGGSGGGSAGDFDDSYNESMGYDAGFDDGDTGDTGGDDGSNASGDPSEESTVDFSGGPGFDDEDTGDTGDSAAVAGSFGGGDSGAGAAGPALIDSYLMVRCSRTYQRR